MLTEKVICTKNGKKNPTIFVLTFKFKISILCYNYEYCFPPSRLWIFICPSFNSAFTSNYTATRVMYSNVGATVFLLFSRLRDCHPHTKWSVNVNQPQQVVSSLGQQTPQRYRIIGWIYMLKKWIQMKLHAIQLLFCK